MIIQIGWALLGLAVGLIIFHIIDPLNLRRRK
jgi:uncharacterized membrane protein